jgi:hypothetical protein
MLILGIDPGPTTSGVVFYCTESRAVLAAASALTADEVIGWIRGGHPSDYLHDRVIIEQVMSQGQSGNDLLRTAEVSGRFWQVADDVDCLDLPPVYMPRREVCSALAISGGGKDAQIREAMIELHGGSKAAAVGSKKAPGPLYGVTGHAWQALGLVRGWMAREAIAAAGGGR